MSIGASIDLRPEDTVAASDRNFAAHIAMGISLKYLLKETAANNSDESRASILSCRCALSGSTSSAAFLADPFNLATGLALFHKLEKKTQCGSGFLGRRCSFARGQPRGLKVRRHSQTADPLRDQERRRWTNLGSRKHSALEEFSYLAKDYGFPSILVDGNDVVAVWRAAQESIHRARNGAGPTLIECQTEVGKF